MNMSTDEKRVLIRILKKNSAANKNDVKVVDSFVARLQFDLDSEQALQMFPAQKLFALKKAA